MTPIGEIVVIACTIVFVGYLFIEMIRSDKKGEKK